MWACGCGCTYVCGCGWVSGCVGVWVWVHVCVWVWVGEWVCSGSVGVGPGGLSSCVVYVQINNIDDIVEAHCYIVITSKLNVSKHIAEHSNN